MTDQPELYSGLSGGRVLDVGTGRGGFIEELIGELKDYDEVIGIDTDEKLAAEFASRFADNSRIRFQAMDAMSMSFEDDSFDMVAVAGSLHHLDDPPVALGEMLRVLRPGGQLVIVEMYRDGQSETQQTHVLLHHWWAAIDRLGGTVHRETYTRAEIVDLISGLDLADLRMQDYKYLETDPKDHQQRARFDASIDEYLERAAGDTDLIAQGAAIRTRLRDIGFHSATLLVGIGEKPAVE